MLKAPGLSLPIEQIFVNGIHLAHQALAIQRLRLGRRIERGSNLRIRLARKKSQASVIHRPPEIRQIRLGKRQRGHQPFAANARAIRATAAANQIIIARQHTGKPVPGTLAKQSRIRRTRMRRISRRQHTHHISAPIGIGTNQRAARSPRPQAGINIEHPPAAGRIRKHRLGHQPRAPPRIAKHRCRAIATVIACAQPACQVANTLTQPHKRQVELRLTVNKQTVAIDIPVGSTRIDPPDLIAKHPKRRLEHRLGIGPRVNRQFARPPAAVTVENHVHSRQHIIGAHHHPRP